MGAKGKSVKCYYCTLWQIKDLGISKNIIQPNNFPHTGCRSFMAGGCIYLNISSGCEESVPMFSGYVLVKMIEGNRKHFRGNNY